MEENNTKELNNSKTSKTEDTIISPNLIKNEEMPKRVIISIDNTIENVIQYQNKGYSIFFSDEDNQFLKLTTEEMKKLNPYNAEKYRVAKAIVEKTLDLSSIKTSHMKFKPKATYASATNRLRVENKKPHLHYAWKRQDELQQVIYDGGRVCLDPEIRTFGSFDETGKSIKEKDSTHYVMADGVIELVLTETPIEIYQARRDAIDARSVRNNEAVESQARAEIDALGGNSAEVERKFSG
jgi:hypothetical protein